MPNSTPKERRLRRILQAEANGQLPLPEFEMDPHRTLTDADVQAILAAFEKRLYINVGKGFLNGLWKAVVAVILGVYAIGAMKGWWK